VKRLARCKKVNYIVVLMNRIGIFNAKKYFCKLYYIFYLVNEVAFSKFDKNFQKPDFSSCCKDKIFFT